MPLAPQAITSSPSIQLGGSTRWYSLMAVSTSEANETGQQKSVKNDDWRTVFDGVIKPF